MLKEQISGLEDDGQIQHKIFYTNEKFDDVFVNFLSIESVYIYCNKTFPSKIVSVFTITLSPHNLQIVESTIPFIKLKIGFSF